MIEQLNSLAILNKIIEKFKNDNFEHNVKMLMLKKQYNSNFDRTYSCDSFIMNHFLFHKLLMFFYINPTCYNTFFIIIILYKNFCNMNYN